MAARYRACASPDISFNCSRQFLDLRFESSFKFSIEVLRLRLIDIKVDAQYSSGSRLAFVHRCEIRLRHHGVPPFCARYDVGLDVSANCVVIAARRGDVTRYAACMVLATSRADVNGVVNEGDAGH